MSASATATAAIKKKLFRNIHLPSSLSHVLITGPRQFQYKGHNYFYSGEVPALATKRVDWLEARNVCREYCMDAVSIETQEENNLIFKLIQEKDVPYIWTSGRLCDFNGKSTHDDAVR